MSAGADTTDSVNSSDVSSQHKRCLSLEALDGGVFDAIVIGGGINGAVSTLAMAAHGMRVALVERNDFGSGTSQESSCMVWGGFKYLESRDLKLVAGLCDSRNRLAKAFPTRLAEARFLAAIDNGAPFPPWFASLGAVAYWGLGRLATQPPRHRSSATIERLEPSVDTSMVRGGVEYSDYLLVDNDSRFVSEMVFGATRYGATIANRVDLVDAEHGVGGWRLSLVDRQSGKQLQTTAQVLVNAAGPEVPVVGNLLGASTENRLVYSKGIHLVVPRITDSGRILAFFDDDERLFYVLPMGNRSVIGTTDTRVEDPIVDVTAEDRTFVLDQINARIDRATPLCTGDVIAERCGVRALVVPPDGASEGRDWTELSREHAVEVERTLGVVSVLGGKLSDCLNVGEEVVEAVQQCGLASRQPVRRWYGEPGRTARRRFNERATGLRLNHQVAEDLWRRQGMRAFMALDLIDEDRGLGEPMGDLIPLTEAEVRVMANHEWIFEADDFLRRRTMLSQVERHDELLGDPAVLRALELLRVA
ncbi:MAG: FAD-dependent oxidoreductase [Acidimicrobiales bacterium]|nr:FAD-dependent oxidoreductase [Acidimicrobiales bacterium]